MFSLPNRIPIDRRQDIYGTWSGILWSADSATVLFRNYNDLTALGKHGVIGILGEPNSGSDPYFNRLTYVALSPDGRFVATASQLDLDDSKDIKEVRVWQLPKGKLTARLKNP
jgi:hypothetical protein